MENNEDYEYESLKNLSSWYYNLIDGESRSSRVIRNVGSLTPLEIGGMLSSVKNHPNYVSDEVLMKIIEEVERYK